MKFNRIFAAVLAAAMLIPAVGCGKKNDYTSNDTTSNSGINLPEQTQPSTEPIKAAADGPKLYIKDTTAAPGEYAEVTMAVKDAEMKWTMCGIHVTYPNVLEPQMFKPDERMAAYKRGDASEYSTASVCKVWIENMPEELTKDNLGCLFFTEVFDGDTGLDGDIVTFKLKIPDDAKPGTVYPIGFYYMPTDIFINDAEDLAMQQYVFENWQPGTVTVK